MTFTANYKKLASFSDCEAPKRDAMPAMVGIFRTIIRFIFESIHESQPRKAERDIANFFARRGGCITDAFEREVTRRLFSSDWSPRD
jgi:hypothetical protein